MGIQGPRLPVLFGLSRSIFEKTVISIFFIIFELDFTLFKETIFLLSQMLDGNHDYEKELGLYMVDKTKLKGFQTHKNQ